MTGNKFLYEQAQVWDQDLQKGQGSVVQALSDFMPSDVSNALDVGCGDGKITSAVIAATGKHFVGLDSSKEALSRCGFETILGDAERLPFADQQFDFSMSVDTFEHLPDQVERRAWSELFRVSSSWVAVVVPFRENLLDAAIKCGSCHHIFHANWHLRSYDWRDLSSRAPEGWSAQAVVLAGEPWTTRHPLETEYRRKVLGEWAGWDSAVCPHCSKVGAHADESASLKSGIAEHLARAIQQDLNENPLERQYSEVLCLYRSDRCKQPLRGVPEARQLVGSDIEVSLRDAPIETDLAAFPQYPRVVKGVADSLVVQFPPIGHPSGLCVKSDATSSSEISITVEDGRGVLALESISLAPQGSTSLDFTRKAMPGNFGLLVRIPVICDNLILCLEPFDQARSVRRYASDGSVAYHKLEKAAEGLQIYVQVRGFNWFNAAALLMPFHAKSAAQVYDAALELNRKVADVLSAAARSALERAMGTARIALGSLGPDKKPEGGRVSTAGRLRSAVGLADEFGTIAGVLGEVSSVGDIAESPDINVYDLEDGRPRIVMFCHDQHLDRRVISEARSLIALNCKVTLFALSYTGAQQKEVTAEGIRLIRVGLSTIVPTNTPYRYYRWSNGMLGKAQSILCQKFGFGRRVWTKLTSVAYRLNQLFYHFLLAVRYGSVSSGDPLPFTNAFLAAARGVSADLIQVHDLPALEAASLLAQERKVPLVYDAHELYPEQKSFSYLQKRLCSKVERELIKKAQVVFTVNESIAVEMAKRYEISKPHVLLNALDPPPSFHGDQDYDLLREKLGLSADRKVLLYQGGYSPNRNLEKIVEAMALVTSTDVDLVLLGFGAFGDVLRSRAKTLGLLDRRVFFLKAVPASELLKYSASADMGIIPYPHVDLNSYFCTPNKLFEFIQAGLPILANDSPELRRFVQETGFGIVAPMRNAQDIASAIDTATSFASAERWRENIRRDRKKYSWELQGQIYLDAIHPVLSTVNSSNWGKK